MSEFKAASFSDEFGGGPDLIGITTMTSPYYFVPPSGSTAERPQSAPPGMLRFNTDIGRLEVWRNDHWATILGESPNLGDTTQSTSNSATGTGTRAVFCRGNSNGPTVNRNTIDYITIPTLGNAQDFGDDIVTARQGGALSSSTRALIAGRDSVSTAISFITFASTGDATNFTGTLTASTGASPAGISNSTRGIFAGGIAPTATTKMDYVTIASNQDAKDFGDLSEARDSPFGCASSVRGIVAGGYAPSPGSKFASIDYITFSTTGNAQDFGDLSGFSTNYDAGINGSVRGVLAGSGVVSNTAANVCHYVTMSTTGNTQNFGDLTVQRLNGASGASSATRGVIAGGRVVPGSINNIEFITIASTGNAQDFGDLTAVVNYGMGGSSTTRGIFTAVNPAFVSNYVTIASTGDGTDFGEIGVLTLSLLDGQIASNGHGGL